MRLRDFLLAFVVFCCFMAAGFLFTFHPQAEFEQKEEAVVTAKKENTITENTEMIYQYYYTKDGVTKEQKEPVQDFLLGLNRAQLESIYVGWQLLYFSPEKVILRSSVEGKSTESFLLGEYEGYLAVYRQEEGKQPSLMEKTDIPIAVLPEMERNQLQEGIRVNGEENLAKLLSDYTS